MVLVQGSIEPAKSERYEEADFPHMSPPLPSDDQGLTFVQYVEYKHALLGTIVPKQYASDEALIKVVYLSWKHYTIVSGMMNW